MNPLDDLISSSSGVPDVTADGLARGRAALDGAIAAGARQESPARRKAAAHWFGGLRGKAIIGVAGVAAVAAAAAVIVLPSSSPHTAGSRPGDSSVKPTLKAGAQPKPSASGQAAGSPMTYSITPINVTAAYVFAQAAKGAQYTPEGNVPLVNGWPDALYWHTVTESTNTGCPSVVNVSQVWLGESGSEIVSNHNQGSAPAGESKSIACGGGPGSNANNTYPVGNVPTGPMIGGEIYTWAQFAALPTDPAALWPILQDDSTVGVAPYKGMPEQDWLYQTIIMTLEQDPVSPAMRVALLKDAEKISGVTVVGKYTDSLGRTGIALRQGSADSVVIDTSNGQVLTDFQPAPAHQGCTVTHQQGDTETSCAFGGATLFISADATNTEPHVNQPAPFLSLAPVPSASARASKGAQG
ncbi:MAG TPA: hypothetical protein VI365_12260 [Trebonia sp.]